MLAIWIMYTASLFHVLLLFVSDILGNLNKFVMIYLACAPFFSSA